jgi:ABC-type transport system substrate-binding protein
VGPDQYGYSRELRPRYNHDPARAKKLLAQAGYPNGFDVDFLVPLGQYNKVKDVAEAIGGMLGQVGIRAKLRTQDQDSGFAAIQNDNLILLAYRISPVVSWVH